MVKYSGERKSVRPLSLRRLLFQVLIEGIMNGKSLIEKKGMGSNLTRIVGWIVSYSYSLGTAQIMTKG